MSLDKDLVFIVWQYLNEEKHTEAAHVLEKESRIYFDLKYFEEILLDGKFDEAESYLSGFTKFEDNMYSTKIFFEIRKQKYLEALDRKDRYKAFQILNNDLKVFKSISPEVYTEITELVTMDDFRENEQLKQYKDTQTQRISLLREIKTIVQDNPLIRPLMVLPNIRASRLRALINQSVSWQHMLCKNPQPYVDVRTLFVDHVCAPSTGALTPAPVNNPLVGSSQNGGAFRPFDMQPIFIPQVGPASHSLPAWLTNYRPPTGATPHGQLPNAGPLLQWPRPRTPSAYNGGIVCQSTDSKHVMEPSGATQADEIKHLGATCSRDKYSGNDLPKIVVRTLNQGSNVVSLDFHPEQQTIILVGTDVGDIAIWEVGSSEKLAHKSFKDWIASNRTMVVQAALSESVVSVIRCVWSPDGAFIGVAFSKHIVHIYRVAGELTQHLEIDAHIGGVNDIAFVYLQGKLCLVSCGDDKIIKVWDGETGYTLYSFEGHEAPVYSVCPHSKGNVQFTFSIDVAGRIKAWVYDPPSCRVNYDAPGRGCTSMAYSVDGSRLFTCGTSKEGESYLVEWDDNDGTIKRSYSGLEKQSSEVVKFATTKNRFLAAGDQCQIKFWDMDDINILSTTDAEGCLQARPFLCFNKMGYLLAVTTRDNRIKILANADGVELLRLLDSRRLTPETKDSLPNLIGAGNTTGPVLRITENTEIIPPMASMNGTVSTSMVNVKRRLLEDEVKSKSGSMNWKFVEVTDPVQCRSIRLTDPLPTGKIVRLLYAHSRPCILALDSNAIHKQWLWQRNDQNPSGKVNPNVQPQFWQPKSGTIMKNDTSDRGLGEVVPCIALSNNDSYVISASGGKVSLFSPMSFKLMEDYMPPPPAATCLAFYPLDNNVIAIGMEDSTIQIFNIQQCKVIVKLEGHQKRITGLAFSKALNTLVSSGADAQLCVWNTNGWEKCKSKAIHSPAGRLPSPLTDTTIELNSVNQVQLLVVQESQIAIYDASELEYVCHWTPRDPMPSRISSATYSCDGVLVYASFIDGSIGVFDSQFLRPRCRIAPSAFIPDMGSGNTYPVVITASPKEPNQIAVGLTDGGIHVIEPAP